MGLLLVLEYSSFHIIARASARTHVHERKRTQCHAHAGSYAPSNKRACTGTHTRPSTHSHIRPRTHARTHTRTCTNKRTHPRMHTRKRQHWHTYSFIYSVYIDDYGSRYPSPSAWYLVAIWNFKMAAINI